MLTNTIVLGWEPSVNASQQDQDWINCIGGLLRNFSVLLISGPNISTSRVIYTGLGSQFTVSDLNASSVYSFELVMCNLAGCIRSERLEVTTLDPPPNTWISSTRPRFFSINQES